MPQDMDQNGTEEMACADRHSSYSPIRAACGSCVTCCGTVQLNKLMGAFKNETGSDYNPEDSGHNDMMSSIASKVTGTNMPPSLVKKL